jgi:type I restriction enzyme R subunit
MKPYADYVSALNEAYKHLLSIVPTVDSVNELETEDDELNFIKAFRDLMRVKNVLASFSDFSWDDLEIDEQEFEDYKSKYLDLYDKVTGVGAKEKVSILNDVDFELELIHRDEINVQYIIQLLIKLKANEKKDAERVREEITKLLGTEKQLRSKRELIERFIRENLEGIDNTDDIPQEFEKYWDIEQDKAFIRLVEEENLSKERTQALIEHFLYSEKEPMRDEILELLTGDKPTLLQRKIIGERILKKIVDFVETFVNGVVGG